MLKWNYGKVSVGTSATQIVASRTGRKSLLLWGFGSVVYIGPTSGVTTSGLNPYAGGAGVGQNLTKPLSLETEDSVYGIKTSGSSDIEFLETYEE